MTMNMSLLLPVNQWFFSCVGDNKRNVFYNSKEVCPQLQILDKNIDTIINDLNKILPRIDQMPAYHELDFNQTSISAKTPNLWRIFYLHAMGQEPDIAKEYCSDTLKLINQVPNVFQAFFSILEPHKSVPAHTAPFAGYLRYHLALKVPNNSPPVMRIREHFYTWSVGKSILFDDTWEHEIINNCDEIRIIIIVDILRPMPLVPTLVNKAIRFIARFTYAKNVLKKSSEIMAKII